MGSIASIRDDRSNGVIEIGWVMPTTLLQRSVHFTETLYLLMRYLFNELGYKRCECDDFDQPSCNCVTRLGFKFEVIFQRGVAFIVTKNR